MTVEEALKAACARFAGSASPELDAQVLLAQVLQKDRTWLYAWPEHALTPAQAAMFGAACARRERGEPIAYITGSRGFWNLELDVGPGALIPRPETELLVEAALVLGKNRSGKVADLGTGTGAIAIALAQERPDWQVFATELSPEAQAIAARNMARAACTNLQLLAGDWCEPLPGRDFLLILSNPPYIDGADPHLAQGDVRFEPRSALVAGEGGLADLRRIAEAARSRLIAGGWLLLEHGWQQGEAVRNLLERLGYTAVSTYRDLGGRERVTAGRAKEARHE